MRADRYPKEAVAVRTSDNWGINCPVIEVQFGFLHFSLTFLHCCLEIAGLGLYCGQHEIVASLAEYKIKQFTNFAIEASLKLLYQAQVCWISHHRSANQMIRFMICDTDAEFLNKLAAALHSHFDPCSVEYMFGPSALEVSLRSDSGGADVLLTEIELRGHNAISIIAQYLKDSSPLQIIYMTSKIEYCTEVYETRHCGFLLKPIKLDRLLRDVRRALNLLEKQMNSGIVVQQRGGFHIISPQSLHYVESHGRVLKLITDCEMLEIYDKLDRFSFQLDKRFLQCHKSFLVNMERVKRYRGDSFLMCDGSTIPISQSKRKEVRQQFLAYMGSAAPPR